MVASYGVRSVRRLLPLLVVSVLVPAATAHASSVVEVRKSSPLTVGVLERLGLDVTHGGDADSAQVLLRSAAERRRLEAAGFRPRTIVADLEAAHAEARELDAVRAKTAERALPSGRAPLYRVLSDYETELTSLERPGLVRGFELPKRSLQGKPIRGIEIATSAGHPSDGRPVYVVSALHHAREWPSGEIAMEFAHELVKRFDAGDARVRTLLSKVRVFIVPVSNPDGFVQSRGTVPALGGGADPLHRRNCRPIDPSEEGDPCGSGVDPNRNYGALWGGPGASADPSSDSYRGPAEFSEPETQAFHEFSQRLQITNFQSLHNIAGQVLRQPGNFDYGETSPDEARFKALGDPMAAAVGYDSLLGWQLYPVHGATEDWNYIAQGSMGYTIEIGPPATGTFQGPYQTHVVDQFEGGPAGGNTGKGLRESLLLAAEQAGDETAHAVLAGTAPAGRVIRVRKEFRTSTSTICASDDSNDGGRTCATKLADPRTFADFIDTSIVVPANGRFELHVNPSTRPYSPAGSEPWTLTCESATGEVLQRADVVLGRGGRLDGALACGEAVPDGATALPGTGNPATGTAARAFRLRVVGGTQRLRTILRRGVLVRASCTAGCRMRTSVKRGRRTLGRRTVTFSRAGSKAFRVRLSRAGKRSLRRRAPRRLSLVTSARNLQTEALRTARASVTVRR